MSLNRLLAYDLDADGSIKADEVRYRLYHRNPRPNPSIAELHTRTKKSIMQGDTDGYGILSLWELNRHAELRMPDSSKRTLEGCRHNLERLIALFDTNDDGPLGRDELRTAMQSAYASYRNDR